jgi:seryl-tRNA synthetase
MKYQTVNDIIAERNRLRAEVANRNQRALDGDKAQAAFNTLYDEVERLRAENQTLAKNLGECSGGYQTMGREIDALKQRIAELEAALSGRWVSVRDRLPDSDEPVLVYTPQNQHAKMWIDCWSMRHEAPLSFSSMTIEIGYMWEAFEFEEVTHWMSLPVAPIDEEAALSGGVHFTAHNTINNPSVGGE